MIIALVTTTLNGKIALSTDDEIKWHSDKDIKYFVEDTKKAGVVVMGSTTFEQIVKRGRILPGRHKVVMAYEPQKLIDKYKDIQDVEFTNDSPHEIISKLKKKFKDICIVGGGEIYTLYLKKKFIDEIRATVAPFIFGKNSIDFVSSNLDSSVSLKLKTSEVIDDDYIRLIYSVSYE